MGRPCSQAKANLSLTFPWMRSAGSGLIHRAEEQSNAGAQGSSEALRQERAALLDRVATLRAELGHVG